MAAVVPSVLDPIAAGMNHHDPLANPNRGRNRSASDAPYPATSPTETSHGSERLPRAASYTYFPQVKDLLEEGSSFQLKELTLSETADPATSDGDVEISHASPDSSPETETAPVTEEPPQLKRTTSRRASRLLRFTSRSRDSSAEPSLDRSNPLGHQSSDSLVSLSPSRNLNKLRRKSWITPSSRSSSPSKDSDDSGKPAPKGQKPSASKRRSFNLALSSSEKAAERVVEKAAARSADSPPTPKNRVLTKQQKKSLGGLFTSSNNTESSSSVTAAPTVPPLPKSFSTDRLPFVTDSPTKPSHHVPPLPRNMPSEKLKGAKTEPRKKDELWTVFRTLEADLRKFQAKSIALKANVLRLTLLPFLRAYASHPSNHRLRPEDLDRRTNILNGWWTGLLEMIAGRNNTSISGTDRPAILEGITGIMERPEWRLSPSPFCALADRAETSSTSTANSTASLSSGASDFLAESVYHNVRNTFTQNLLSQMAFVVDKMSLRNAPASLVTFCGKTCAYAFLFCPGIADVLVRLWDLSTDLMRRVLDESGVSRVDKLDLVAENIVPSFPPTLRSLKFQSLAKTVRLLRRPIAPPLGTAQLDWHGPWLKRWSGAESDLFYVFVKHYHILVTDFLPVEPSNTERICVPGLVMVHAQVLSNVDATINRQATALPLLGEPMSGPASITFDDVLTDPDTTVSLPMPPPANAARQMAENRVIMLIRDFLSERNVHLNRARRIFAEGFGRILKAAARKVSIYDNNACYTLCDFLEEAFVILVRYELLSALQHSVLDWPFWLSVCKAMTSSQNTATEIKLFAFLYSTWSTVAADEGRRKALCLEFLLEPEFFESMFSHWCPMVRAYFMRLVCWRVARYDGVETPTDVAIMKALSDRLRSVWGHYLWLREEAEIRRTLLPSTSPCHPAPGRRFLIIRSDAPIPNSAGPFISFDGVVQSPLSRRLSAINGVPDVDERPVSAGSQDFPDEDAGKSRWSLLRNLIGTPKSATKLTKASGSSPKDNSKTGASASSSKGDSRKSSGSSDTSSQPPHRAFSFRFSLEWVDKRFQNPQNMRLGLPRLPLPAQVLLQNKGINIGPVESVRPVGPAAISSRYAGRALAEWTLIAIECQNFFERRKNEGVPNNKLVETPSLGVEAVRRPG